MNKYYLTYNQVYEALKTHRYVLFITYSGKLIGYNSGILNIPRVFREKELSLNGISPYIGYIGCSLNEYINYKAPFQR